MIRWMSTNSAILHLDSSRRHEMSVDSSPFMRLVLLSLLNLFTNKGRLRE